MYDITYDLDDDASAMDNVWSCYTKAAADKPAVRHKAAKYVHHGKSSTIKFIKTLNQVIIVIVMHEWLCILHRLLQVLRVLLYI